MAKQKDAPQEQVGNKYAHLFPGGKPLHDEGGKLNWQWEEIGQKLVGEYLGIKPYKNGHIAKVRDADGIIRVFSAPAVLASYLDEQAAVGDTIGIVYAAEKAATKRGHNPTKLFEVYKLD